ncbi:ATP-dependent DNA helicase [Paenibacillus lycopersici]|uniref:ATP-dependent DNA helicase n=1 Tax=Paenibacillus lycopersici TaxID=2704462 RepID=A0A6C0G1S1_9BACL|nr:ATP-dependent DNA helicase [Paenibacillus lycopersici]QHT61611.1 ATP-dependent DNA helicase [Paenibacillus lycopersici]
MTKYPFDFDPKTPFVQQASDWIADVFYERLPEAGFELRDEQIYMAFQLERAYHEKRTIFAEAGVGTGKTFVYLLYAILYARYTRKPAIIACADESLIEQLVKPEGDIAKLARYLDLTIDARLGKSMDQYLCLNKLDDARGSLDNLEAIGEVYASLPDFVNSPGTMQAFHPYGNRKDYPHLTDEQWNAISWDVFQDCLVCSRRHRCGQTLSREHYRKAADIIICSHDFYMEHVWTYEARKREGQLPLLPEHSSVVFDEGHLLETAAQSALTYKLKHSVFESIITRLLQSDIRESLALVIEDAIAQSELLFDVLDEGSVAVEASDRREVPMTGQLLREVDRFSALLSAIEEELVFESGMFTIDAYQLTIVEEHLEMLQLALRLFKQPEGLITWVERDRDGTTLVIMPKMVKEILRERVFAKQMPVAFSSATLSVGGSFQYVADSLGIEDALSFSVASPYEYEERMRVAVSSEPDRAAKLDLALERLRRSEGRALVLFPSKEELSRFRDDIAGRAEFAEFRFLFEGTAEISHLIAAFQNDEHSVLCAVTLWEGLDIPGPALSHVMMWALPFPPHDPVFAARRRESADPFGQVDMPYMLLRLRQGVGRLIRKRDDEGIVTIFGRELEDDAIAAQVRAVLPQGVEWTLLGN